VGCWRNSVAMCILETIFFLLLHTEHMDENDFRIAIDETFEQINRLLEELAIDGLEMDIEDGMCVIEFSDQSRILLSRKQNERTLLFELPSGRQRFFYYHEIEESWFDRKNEEELFVVLGRVIEATVGIQNPIAAA